MRPTTLVSDVQKYLQSHKILVLSTRSLDYRLHLEIDIKDAAYPYVRTCFLVSTRQDVLEDI